APRRRPTWARSKLAQNFARRTLARADRPVHVAVPVVRGLGPGPVDPPDRLTEPGAVGEERSRRGDPDRASPAPLVRRPERLEEARRLERVGAEELGVLAEHRRLPRSR